MIENRTVRTTAHPADARRPGFTLIELLVVMLIILLVSVVVLPTVVTALGERSVVNGATLLQGALVGARDAAIASKAPAGIRLLADPTLSTFTAAGQVDATKALACNRWVPTSIPPVYTEGTVNAFPGVFQIPPVLPPNVTGGFPYSAAVTVVMGQGGNPCLVVEENPGNWQQTSTGGWVFLPAPPTSWFWTIRVGEKIRFGAGAEYTVCGPMVIPPAGVTINGTFYANPEGFVNVGPPGATNPLTHVYIAPDGVTQSQPTSPEFLCMVNNLDDGPTVWGLQQVPPVATYPDGYIDNGWDGIDNNGNGQIDEWIEWEIESWLPGQVAGLANQPYTIRRRPAPTNGAAVYLPSSVVIDLTSSGRTNERSRLPLNPWMGGVDLLVNPDGTPWVDLPYAVPTSLGLGAAFYHFWLTGRDQITDMPVPALATVCQLPCPPAGDVRIVSLGKSGRVSVLQPATSSFNPANPAAPFIPIQQGVTGGNR